MRVEFIENYRIDSLSPADYNPRQLDEDKFVKLQESLRKFGIVKPLIVNGDNGILTAGHQRTRAIKSLGIEYAPVVRIKGIKIQDEIRFNLFHNSIETNKTPVKIVGDLIPGYQIIEADRVRFEKNKNAVVVNQIGRLIHKYGEWGSIVADEDGNVLLNSDYAVSSKLCGTEIICFVIENSKRKELMEYLSEEYGVYEYSSLGIKSYNQLYCQMNRLVTGGKTPKTSSTYEKFVIPTINKSMRILDFGAGKCAYVNRLKKQGYSIFAYEPNFQDGTQNINMSAVVKMLRQIEKDVETNGLYDCVVLDSVLNSVVNLDVEKKVIATCNAFLKSDGVFITGTRNLNNCLRKQNAQQSVTNERITQFLDKDNFTATFRNGVWTMQHFHNTETLANLLKQYFDDVETYDLSKSNIWAVAKKPKSIDEAYLEEALEFELNMEYPNNYRHNKHLRLKELLLEKVKER